MKHDTFMQRFFREPSATEILGKFMWKQEEHLNVSRGSDKPEVDTMKLSAYLKDLASNYFNSQTNGRMRDDVANAAVREAEELARLLKSDSTLTSGDISIAPSRLRLQSMLELPDFISSPTGLQVLKVLRDIDRCEPWSYQMLVDHTEKNGYVLKRNWGLSFLEGLVRIVEDEEIWSNRSHGFSVLATSIAEALRLLSKGQSAFTKEGAPARMKIILRNRDGLNRHEPECAAAFSPTEFIQAALKGVDCSAIAEEVNRNKCWAIPHLC